MNIPILYVPSYYGDVSLTAAGERGCVLSAERITVGERAALAKLTEYARKKGWIGDGVDLSVMGTTTMTAPLERVSKVLAKALKPGRTLVTAVRFRDGRMEELAEGRYVETGKPETALAKPEPAPEPPARAEEPEPPKAAVAVAVPRRGCPEPVALTCEVRATRVLNAFLNAEQRDDYARFGRFVSVGADTGHRYVVASRNAPGFYQFGAQLYDLDESRSLCVHDEPDATPPAEESLAIHVCVSLPGWESYIRRPVHDWT